MFSCENYVVWPNEKVPTRRLLPDWIPFHPSRWWVQCRVVYLPTSYLYANKCQKHLNPFLESLRKEIYVQPFSSINFAEHRCTVAVTDRKKSPASFLNLVNSALLVWESYFRPSWLHQRANKAVRALIQREDENTSYNDLAPVNKAFHMVVVYFTEGEASPRLARHREKLITYLWQSRDGMTSGGTNGAQLWDTAFSILAAVEAGLAKEPQYRAAMMKALRFLDVSQLRGDLVDSYRQKRSGGWPFSTKDNGYIVSDCSAEAMKGVIMLQEEWYVRLVQAMQ